jgi:hypothetical protein
MPSLDKFIDDNTDRCITRFLQARKVVRHFFVKNENGHKKILFIVGCQRSGTTLMTRIFERDRRTWVYGEFSKLSSLDKRHKIRLNPLSAVKEVVEKNKASLIILKPLVESQNTLKLLDYFDGSKALWMYRDYKNVLLSNLQHWGLYNGIKNLRAIVTNEPDNWRSENVSEYTRGIINKYFSENMNPYDAAALFWFARNRLFFELGLDENPRVLMCKYEDLLSAPPAVMRGVYAFLEYDYPTDDILVDIHANPKEKRKAVELLPEVDALCEDLLDKLHAAYQVKLSAVSH